MNCYASTSSILSVLLDGRYVRDAVPYGWHRRCESVMNLFNNCYVYSCVNRRYELLYLYCFDNFRPIGRTVRQGWPYPTVGTLDANEATILLNNGYVD